VALELLEFAGNVGLALVLGTLIGLERQFTQHAAGLRTNALVAVGAALFVTLDRVMGDPAHARVASYIVVGIGFLGGGVIVKEGRSIHGLTTAAALWCSAAVGTLAGAGFAAHAATGTLFALVVLGGFLPLDRCVAALHRRFVPCPACYCIRVKCGEKEYEAVRAVLLAQLGAVAGAKVTAVRSKRRRDYIALKADVTASPENDGAIQDATGRLMTVAGVLAASWEKVPTE
jgi:putative Mg2+ transporter-C (MgtC) family protein